MTNLSKINLTKDEPSFSLTKKDISAVIKANLNWNKNSGKPGFLKRLFGCETPSDIDLDLGAFIRRKDGTKTVVQALGNAFGKFRDFPFTELLGDDRTGAYTDGEWMQINGAMWHDIDEILIFAYVYDGKPEWNKTNGRVTVLVPKQPSIEVSMETDSSNTFCAVCSIKNVNDEMVITRLNTYHKGHKDCDHVYNWGFNWTPGSK